MNDTDALNTKLQKLKEELTISRYSTSKYIQKVTSAPNPRPMSIGIGVV